MKLINRLLLLFLFIFASSCTSPPPKWTQTYEGDALPSEQEVKMHHYFQNYGEVLVIDGVIHTKSRDDAKTRYTLTPGAHQIDYYLRVYKRGWVIGSFIVDMKAGHTYILRHNVKGHMFSPWETTVILLDNTLGEDIEIEYFPAPMHWDQDVDKLQEKYEGAEK